MNPDHPTRVDSVERQVRVFKTLEFDAGHRLMGHEGKCINLHGHRWRVEIEVEALELDSVGRVIDFSVIKGLCGKWIDDNLDHNMIFNKKDRGLIRATSKYCRNGKPYLIDGNPTSENIGRELTRVFANMLNDKYGDKVWLTAVRLWETPTSCAEIT